MKEYDVQSQVSVKLILTWLVGEPQPESLQQFPGPRRSTVRENTESFLLSSSIAANRYVICECKPLFQAPCVANAQVGDLYMKGPYLLYQNQTMGDDLSLQLTGVGFSASDRVCILAAMNCLHMIMCKEGLVVYTRSHLKDANSRYT